MNRIVFAVVLLFSYISVNYAQYATGGKFGLGVKGGIASYYGNIENRDWGPHVGLSFYNWMTDHLGFGLEAGYTSLKAGKDATYFENVVLYLGAAAKAKLLSDGNVQPYFLLGVEGLKMSPEDINGNKLPVDGKFQFGFQLGGGLSVYMSDYFSVDLQGIYHPVFTDKLDGQVSNSGNDSYLTTALKATFYFGGDRDSDGDGIFDKLDRCPKQAEDFDGFQDKDGCPDPDNDSDGIPDKTDKCPNKAEDIDNFQDRDGCPDTDNDEDGIPDARDKCPGTDETVKKGTNTREDLDGFKDDDGCPDPDNDGDGIPDEKDKCPNDAETINGWEDQDGCPDKIPQVRLEKEKPLVLKGVYFQTGSAKLDPNSEDILDGVLQTLKENKHIQIDVRGHTDNRGSTNRNRELSLQRAESVKSYLVKNGITQTRITTQGFGPDKPVATNDTQEGRARNRRIEFYRTK